MATQTTRGSRATRAGKERPVEASVGDDPVTNQPPGVEPEAANTVGDRQESSPTDATTNHARAAADRATRHNSTRVSLPLVGEVRLPAPDELAFIGGVAVLAVVGAVEWPVAVILGAGHALASTRRNKVVQEFGEALERG